MAGLASVFDDLSVQWLKNVYLLGVDLTLDDGRAYPEEIYNRGISGAVRLAENTFGINIDQIDVDSEQHDLLSGDRQAWYSFQLDHLPVLEITAVRIRYGSLDPITIPLSWVKLTNATQGQVNIIPAAPGDLGSFLFTSGMPILTMGFADYVPAYFEFDYKAGVAQESGTLTLSGTTPAAVVFERKQAVTEYETVFTPPAFKPVVTARTATTFTAQLTTASPGPVTYEWSAPSIFQRGTVTFNGAGAVVVNLQKKTLTLDYGITFTPPDFGVKLTARGVSGFTAKMTAPPAWAVAMDWRMSQVPADLRHWIGMHASLVSLNIAGSLIGGAGIANSSIGVDGFSQSIGTTSSAENGGYSDRIREFEREMPPLTAALKGRYKRLRMVVV